jgi:hypothetical protein
MRTFTMFGVLMLVSLLTACSSTAADPTPTVTPLVIPTLAPSAFPTTTPQTVGNTGADPAEIESAQRALAERSYAFAINLLAKNYASNRENDTVRAALADAYIQWGQRELNDATNSTDRAVRLARAIDRLNSGLALLNPGDPGYILASTQSSTATAFIRALNDLQALKDLAAAEGDLETRQRNGAILVDQIVAVRSQQADFPGLTELTIDALITASAAYEATRLTGESARPLLERARDYCTQAQTLGDTATAPACVARITQRLTAPTATRVPPTPTRAPATPTPQPRLYVSLLNRDEAPNCLSMQITGIGVNGWIWQIDGLNLTGRFDGGGNARICGLGNRQEVTFTILNESRNRVPGGGGIPARGGDIFRGVWR